MTSASCHVLDDDLEFLRFQFVMNKRVANALPNLYLSHSLVAPALFMHSTAIGMGYICKSTRNKWNFKTFSKIFFKKDKNRCVYALDDMSC